METTDFKNRFIELRAKGMSFDKIAKELGKSKATLVSWSRELEEEIASFKALELEALYERHYLTKQLKIQAFGGLLSRMFDELKQRDLSELATDKLLDLVIKYYAVLEEGFTEPRFKSEEDIEEAKAERELLDSMTTVGGQPPRRKLKTV